MELEGKICLITGAAMGIGRSAAEKFAIAGAVVIICDKDNDQLQNTVRELSGSGIVKGFVVDVTRPDDVKNMVDEIEKRYKKIDVLINNAGITDDALLIKMTSDQFDRVIDVNLKGTFNCTREVARIMIGNGKGKIINTASIVGVYGNFGQTNYAAAKSGIIGMTKTWARELGRKNINVNAVAPGFIITSMTEKMPEKILQMMKDKCPLNRWGDPDDVANVYMFLASDYSDFINGAVINVDGGLVL
jgi:3-oxoacyl-[acyl-carrier protein] reductase